MDDKTTIPTHTDDQSVIDDGSDTVDDHDVDDSQNDDSVDESDEEINDSDGDEVEDPLSHGSMVERIGSFIPKRRPGYPNNTREFKIRRSVGRKIYAKRFGIARSIVRSDEDDPQAVLISALVDNDIPPASGTGWTEYVILLADREGGWERFLDTLDLEIARMENASTRYRKSIVVPWTVSMMMFVIVAMSRLSFPYYEIALAVTMSLISLYMSWSILPARNDLAETRAQVLGPRSKKTKDFVRSERL